MATETNATGVRQPFVARRLGRFGAAARCIYCGRRCSAGKLACYKHGDLVAIEGLYRQAGAA